MAFIHLMVDLTPLTRYWRGVIAGAARFATEHPQVRLRMPSSEWELIGDPDRVDGVIAVVPKPDAHDRATRFGKPVVNVSSICHPVPFPTVTMDNRAIGRLAAEHLLSQGYRHFAFHLESRVYFSRERLAGFAERLAESGRTCDVFDTAPPPLPGQTTDRSAAELRQATLEWIRSLPQPLGLFTHNDGRAALLIDICHEAALAVPEQVGVLGVDDDELVTGSCDPTLSSVDNAADRVGYRAGALLMELIAGAQTPSERVLVPPRRIVQRQSTQPVFMDDELLERAVLFIREHATDPIDVADVLEAVPLARRSLERRFRARTGRSPGEEIRRIQIERAKHLLVETDYTLARIAVESGYTRFRNFASAFRRECGIGPSAYRRQFRMR